MMYVTHYQAQKSMTGKSPQSVNFVAVVYGEGNTAQYYANGDTKRPLAHADVEAQAGTGRLIALDSPVALAAEEKVWLRPDGQVSVTKSSVLAASMPALPRRAEKSGAGAVSVSAPSLVPPAHMGYPNGPESGMFI